MNFNASKVKKILANAFRGNKKSDTLKRNNVYWEAVVEEDKGEAFEERKSLEPVASFPEELTEQTRFITNIPIRGENVHITRASVYVHDEGNEPSRRQKRISRNFLNGDCEIEMDSTAAVVNFSESESSVEHVSGGESPEDSDVEPKSLKKLCRGPDLSCPALRGTSALTTFVRDVENAMEGPPRDLPFESNNSLNIEKELNELMGALCNDIKSRECSGSPETAVGSRVNLAFVNTEPDEDNSSHGRASEEIPDYWRAQRVKSRSFADRYRLGKLLRRGRERMSMIEFSGSRRSIRRKRFNDEEDLNESEHRVQDLGRQFLRLAYDRSSVMEPRVTSTVSLPQRPQSALEDRRFPVCSSDCSVISKSSSSRSSFLSREVADEQNLPTSSFDRSIDWTWLEDAMKSLNAELQELPSGKGNSLRVDAGCQTQPDQGWECAEERMRSPAPSSRVSEAISASSERRVVECCGCDEDMPCKAFDEGSGVSGVSGWLRQSMRRVRHFDLGEPPRVRSAPPESLRPPGDGEPAPVPEGSDAPHQSQRPRSDDGRTRARRSVAESTSPQQQDAEAASSNPTSDAQDNLGYESDSTDRHPSPRGRRRRNGDEEVEESEGRSPLGPWPHGLSSVFAGLGCTLGLFNISRFAVLSVHFGSNFILQFLVLSLLLGIPLLAFHAALGQTLGAGPVDMWRISPLFQGIGIALLLAQALIGIYSIVGVSWMFVYFRDSFINKQDAFRWAESFRHYREDNIFATSILNTSGRLEETVPDYLNGVVLQRYGLTSPENAFGHLKFQLTFNLAVVWMIVFVSLSKGLRSYGKVVYVFSLVPVLGVLVMCSKLLGLTPLHRGIFPQTEWTEFFLNPKSWIAAATEVMLTWNLLGAATMQVTSHNRSSKKLWRDVTTIAVITVLVLLLAAFLGNMCHQLITLRGYSYVPSSFERISTYSFLRPAAAALPPSYSIPVRHMAHASLVAGERVAKPGAIHESGYQVIRLATELVPATLAILDGDFLSPFWAVLFYFTMILFGIAQQLAIWHCVITGIMAINAPTLKSWETTITFFTCAAGFILGLPMTTELGIFVVYFLDYCLGGGWWIILLTLLEICAVLMIRGRPYSGENISIALFGKTNNCISLWAIPLLTFAWNVIMPVALLVVCITIFKSGRYRDLWVWKCGNGDYWPLWTREVGVFVQITPLLCIPVVAVIQCYRYLSKGPADIFDRLANLYRPAGGINGVTDEDSTATNANLSSTSSGGNGTVELPTAEDPPPKYTPPPSYSTATGTRIAKLLRQSFRRSVRRIQSVLGADTVQSPRPPPPDYASVLVEMNQNRAEDREGGGHTAEAHAYTAADVAQVLRCSFRRSHHPSAPPASQERTSNDATPPTLVIPPRWNH